MRSLLLRCYPARWRARYGDEFETILEERPLGPFDVADILLGALDAQLRLRRVGTAIAHGRSFNMSLRIGGFAAIIGAVLWPLGFYVFAGDVGDIGPIGPIDRAITTLVLATGSLALVVAVVGLGAFQGRTNPGFAWAAFALPAVGTMASIVGMVTMQLNEAFWAVWSLGTLVAFVGWMLFAIVSFRTAVLTRGGTLLLGVGSVLALVAVMGVSNLPPLLVVAAFVCFGMGWFVLGIQAIRLDRPAAAARPA